MPVTLLKTHSQLCALLEKGEDVGRDFRQHRHRLVERYKRLLRNTTDPMRRDHLLKLIKEAEGKQDDAGDLKFQF